MDDKTRLDHAPDSSAYDLEDILAEFGTSKPRAPQEPMEQSQRLVLKTMDDTFSNGGMETLTGSVEEAGPRAPEPAAEAPAAVEDATRRVRVIDLHDMEDGAGAQYAASDAAETVPEGVEEPEDDAARGSRERARKGRGMSPLVALLALIAVRRGARAGGDTRRPTIEQEDDAELPEMDPEKAVRLYNSQMNSLRFRGRIAAVLSLIMFYLSFAYYSPALPLTGALNGSVRVLSLLLLILEIAVVMTGLDIFTGGLLGIPRRRMGAETLVAVSCTLSMLDAAVLAVMNRSTYGLPFCAVSAMALTFAIWGAYYACKGHRGSFRVLSSSKSLYTVTGERGLAPDEVALLKSRQSVRGFINRSEEADLGDYVYSALTPFLLFAALVLGLLCSLCHGQAPAVLHCISVLLAASATFSCTICFSVPFSAAAAKLSQSGAAIAGWSGLQDIGGSRRVVITDEDVFPRGTVEISRVRVLEGAFTEKVISCTGSVIAASGSGLAAPFADLIRRNGYTVSRVEDFQPHDGGGMTAMVGGESVYVGNSSFMNLMGIRLPQKLNTKNSVYTAINGALVGIFIINYKPLSSVQDALVLLLHSKLEPVFAIRDFNITPAMIKASFKMPTDSFKFPAYTERYRISGAVPDASNRVAAVIARDGMGPLVDVADRGRRAYLSVRISTLISAAGSVFALILLFLLCWAGAFDSATVSNVIIFMLLWLLPIVIAVVGLER
ncbi:MAG: hypothetical protein LUD54_02495 [Oscillospiraceae bacterium]|nr:hypothetical protein [Oscillospiraceae bacterium]